MRFAHLFLPVAAVAPLSSAFVVPDEKVLGQFRLEKQQPERNAGELDVPSHVVDIEEDDIDSDLLWALTMMKDEHDSVFDVVDSYSYIATPEESGCTSQEDGEYGDDGDDSDSDDEGDDDDDDDGEHRAPHRRPRRPHRGPYPHPHPGRCPGSDLCPAQLTIWELLSEDRQTAHLADILSSDTNLVTLLNSSAANYTVFAPTNRALARLPREGGGGKKPSRKFLSRLLRYHIIPGRVGVEELVAAGLQTLPTLFNESALGKNLPQRVVVSRGFGEEVVLNWGGRVVVGDITATNGLIHAINTPLVPPPLTLTQLELSPETFSTFTFGLSKTGLDKNLTNKKKKNHKNGRGGTTFVPTNEAFKRLGRRANAFLFSKRGKYCLRALLQYHLVSNQTLYSDVLYTSTGGIEVFSSKSKMGRGEEGGKEKGVHVVLPTRLGNRTVSVDLKYRHHWDVVMRVNGFERVVELDRIARDGVVHVLDRVLIPPKMVGEKEEEPSEDSGEISPEELEERLLGQFGVEGEQPRIHAEL
ncbi:hypothetical protein N7474_004958 [Penicillium riverlandense]|uniref:uncharacterized protein n=1 Tax=Penicillium riverlandense TaxID=1903569 RepID=UPI0025471C01|nr:uncharacterized protein N7474_004958 [Penicillium riverlandense]KAJ5819367.1 hypothetical protein N7474_004958 [Penicillium riverlandense]